MSVRFTHAGRRPAFALGLVSAVVAFGAIARGGEALPRGVLLPKITLEADVAQSYALYLPSNYDSKRPNALLIFFDPSGLGSVPVELFRETAEMYGVLVAGSNTARNGALKPALAAVEALWKDLHARLNIDPRRVYLSGFSGGAMIATESALARPKAIAGVIGCGGAFLDKGRLDTWSGIPLALIAGTADFNRLLLEDAAADLSRHGAAVRLWIPTGAHEWPEPGVLREAWEWLERRALFEARRPADPALTRTLLRRALAHAGEAETKGLVLEAQNAYASLAAESPDSEEGLMAQSAARRLSSSAVFKSARQKHLRDRERETAFVERVRVAIDQMSERPPDPITRRQIVVALGIDSWREQGSETAQRALERAFYDAYTRGFNGLLQGRLPQALAGLGVAVAIRPDAPYALYNYACALARRGEKQAALKYLKSAVETGRFSTEEIQRDEDLASLRGELEYKQLVRPQM